MPNVKQISIKQSNGTYKTEDIGVDYINVDGLDTNGTTQYAKQDISGQDIQDYIYDIQRDTSDDNKINIIKGDGTSSTLNLAMVGALPVANGTAGLVPAPTIADNTKFLKGDGTWDTPAGGGSYIGDANIDVDTATQVISLKDTTVTAGSYGSTSNVTGSNGTKLYVPKITVDSKGRLTSAGQIEYTSVDSTYTNAGGLSINNTNKTIALSAHAVDNTGYGGGTSGQFGHVKLSDTYNNIVGAAANSIGASQTALYNAYTALNNGKQGKIKTATFSATISPTGSSNKGRYNLPSTYDSVIPISVKINNNQAYICSFLHRGTTQSPKWTIQFWTLSGANAHEEQTVSVPQNVYISFTLYYFD